jgi:hypothetical protein
MDRVVVTSPWMGLIAMQVCALKDATDEEILKVCNRDNPAGTTNGWCTVVRKDEEHPERKPVLCADDPERMHFIVLC